MILSLQTTKRFKKILIVLLSGVLTLLTTAKAKPTISFQFPQALQIPSFSSYVEKRHVDAMKSYSGKRLDTSSLRMIYYHDQTIAVVELGLEKLLIGCELIEIYKDSDGQELLHSLSKINRPLQISFRDMLKLMSQCEQVDRLNESKEKQKSLLDDDEYQADEPYVIEKNNSNNKRGIFSTSPFSLLSGIIPGTKWCGTGDIAEDYHDLGEDADMDRCCRTHDLCPMKVRPYQKRYKLNNNSLYTKSHCICDDMLYSCLKKTNTSAAQLMGSIYFNLVQVPCVEETPHGQKFRKAREGF